ncbi:MAG TPA: protoporphyrinogen oxidase [Candidatus Binataceae bacterium]|nr:protoporphyrinogen oxidase [Candidatus Binataceae bacterium]
MRRVVVIGAGITGLAAAYRMRELAAEREFPLEVIVLDRATRAGGSLETVRRDGFTIETGADSLLTEKPHAIDLARRLGLGAELISTREEFRHTLVVHRGRLVEIPDGFSMLAPARLLPVLKSELFSPLGKLRIALEPFVPKRKDLRDESLAAFVTRRLGREVLERVAQPLAGGIYTADPSRLSIAATTPRFVEMERRHGSLIRGLRAAERARAAATGASASGTSGARWSLFATLRGGIGTLPDALAARLGECVRLGAEVKQIAPRADGCTIITETGEQISADAVICAAPAYAAARMIRASDPRLADMFGAISYASAATVSMTFRESDFPAPPRAFGFVVPIIERRRIIAGSFTSLKFENRAPAGMILVRAFIGGELQRELNELPDDAMVAAARDEFRDLLGVSAAPGFAIVRRWPAAMPQYDVGHLVRVAEIERAAAAIPRLAIAGAAYRGVGIPDCIRGGEQAAGAILDLLARDRR